MTTAFDSIVIHPDELELLTFYYDETPCPRCAGTGRYSTRGRCYACNGRGRAMSDAAHAARELLEQYRDTAVRPADEIAAGDRIQWTAPTTGRKTWRVVAAVDVDSDGGSLVRITTRIEYRGRQGVVEESAWFGVDERVRVYSSEIEAAAWTAALRAGGCGVRVK